MPVTSSSDIQSYLWPLIGVLGALIFYSRFYVQWYVSEKKKESVVPEVFWYMSGVGTLLLLPYAVVTQSPLGALSQCFNIVVYTRNMIHIWRAKGTLSNTANVTINTGAALIAILAIYFAVNVWISEYELNRTVSSSITFHTWFWLGLGLLGQALFASRFLIQWILTEKHKKSMVPPVFWHISIVAATLQALCFTQRQEWIFAIGVTATIVIYARNITLLTGKKNALTTVQIGELK